MAEIIPFRAVRPPRDKVQLVASRPYTSYTEEERRARLENNPYSFLHILNPEYKFDRKLKEGTNFKLVKNRYDEFKEEHTFFREEKPCFYFVKIISREGHIFRGIIGATSIEDYKKGLLRKHEETLATRERTFKEYLKTTGFNPEPVLVAYPDNKRLDKLFEKIVQTRAEYEFTTHYKDTYYLWNIDNPEIIKEIRASFGEMDKMYIADGHHRTASCALLAEEAKDYRSTSNPYDHFMTFNIPESDLIIHEYNRLIKDLNGLKKEEFLMQLDEYFRIDNLGEQCAEIHQPHTFSMYLEYEFYVLYLRKKFQKGKTPLDLLDVQILNQKVLSPILGIKDFRNDSRLSYAPGTKGMPYIQQQINQEKFKVGFGMFPPSLEEIKAIADAGLKLPPKATYIEPKLRNAITIYEY